MRPRPAEPPPRRGPPGLVRPVRRGRGPSLRGHDGRRRGILLGGQPVRPAGPVRRRRRGIAVPLPVVRQGLLQAAARRVPLVGTVPPPGRRRLCRGVLHTRARPSPRPVVRGGHILRRRRLPGVPPGQRRLRLGARLPRADADRLPPRDDVDAVVVRPSRRPAGLRRPRRRLVREVPQRGHIGGRPGVHVGPARGEPRRREEGARRERRRPLQP
mmetsp:Transcript_8367/g.19647  ORF Transcript_8367/g.19647 Transcript_8367/m.19647 type:complete len:214 (+) Transcript_8367:268-909(+)